VVGRIFLKGLTVAFTILVVAALQLLLFLSLPASKESPEREISIPRGATFREVVEILTSRGLLRHPLAFSLYGEVTDKDQKVKAGRYKLTPSLSPLEIMDRLVRGEVMLKKVTIPEGLTFTEIARILKHQGVIASVGDFTALCQDHAFIQSLGIEASSLEGYLFPDTYFFSEGLKPQEVIHAMVDNFRRVWKPTFSQRARELGLDNYQVLILASIVEKETAVPEERPLIAAVFYNRLKRGMPLCSDPTVIYGLKTFNGNLTKEDLRRPTPYNTYLFRGLPPTPICNPGRESILAALYPAQVDYLYFVSRNNGTHHFSRTISEHNRAVWRYQKRRLK